MLTAGWQRQGLRALLQALLAIAIAVSTAALAAAESITVVKVVPGGSSDTFDFDISGGGSTYALSVPAGGRQTQTIPGTAAEVYYTITENVPAGYELTGIECNNDALDWTPDLSTNSVSFAAVSDLPDPVCTFTNTAVTGSITIHKSAGGGSGSFGFTATGPSPIGAFSLTSGGSEVLTGLLPGDYTFTEADNADYDLQNISCDSGNPQVDLASRSVSVTLAAGDSIDCTFENAETVEDNTEITEAVIAQFMTQRIDRLLSERPDRTRIQRRLSGALWAGSPRETFGFHTTDRSTRIEIATSLSRLAARRNEKTIGSATGVYGADLPEAPVVPEPPPDTPEFGPPRFDAWIEGYYSSINASGGAADGQFAIGYIGVDFLAGPNLMIGLLGQVDWMTQDYDQTNSQTDGTGWMVGPYLGAQLSDILFFNARAAWGQSSNNITPVGTYTDNFDTTRWLIDAELTGNIRHGNWRFSPEVSISYIDESQDGYTDSNGSLISPQTVYLGRTEFGPEIAYLQQLDFGIIELHAKLSGIWNFAQSSQLTFVDGVNYDIGDFRGRVEGGLSFRSNTGGPTARLVGYFDGIGSSDLGVYGAEIWLSAPLN